MKRDLTSANGLDAGLEKTIRGIIKEEQFHEFTDLLIEIMLRRKEEFGLPDNRIINEANNLIKRLPSIEIVHINELSNPNWSAQSGRDGIKIAYEVFEPVLQGNNYYREDLYEVLAHEVYHSIALNEKGYSGITNQFFEARGLNELINEAAANRTSTNYSPADKQRGIRDTSGYSSLTMFSPMLSSSFGVSEKELLAAGISENGEFGLLNILMKNINKTPPQNQAQWIQAQNKVSRAQNLISTLSLQFEILHNMEIPMSPKDNNIPESVKKGYREAALTSLIGTMFDAASYRLENDDRPLSPQMIEEYAYSFKSMISFMCTTIPEYAMRGLIDHSQIQSIMQNASGQINEFGNRVLGTRAALGMQNHPHLSQSKDYLMFLAKTGQLMGNAQIASGFGLTIPQDLVGEIYQINTSGREQYILGEDFGGRIWNNHEVSEEITDIFREKSKELKKFSLMGYFKNLFKRIRNMGQKTLTTPDLDIRSISDISNDTIAENIDFKKNRETQVKEYIEVVNTLPTEFANYIEESRINGMYESPIKSLENDLEQYKDDSQRDSFKDDLKTINTTGEER